MEQLAILPDLAPAPRVRRVCCPTCRRPLDRVAAQRAAANRAAIYAADWEDFAATRPGAIAKIVACALRLAKEPIDLRIGKVWEDCRHRIKGGLDANHRAAAARWLMVHVPELAGRFKTRDTAGDPTRARRPR